MIQKTELSVLRYSPHDRKPSPNERKSLFWINYFKSACENTNRVFGLILLGPSTCIDNCDQNPVRFICTRNSLNNVKFCSPSKKKMLSFVHVHSIYLFIS
ncbi:uncharacterized protein DS421_8g237920 [Arachis hypogaea]|nr:uncharacterized protein DS421_8g237920 [Arachis hypogaea]